MMLEEKDDKYDALEREVLALRRQVAELQRVAARHVDSVDISLPQREELLREAERLAHMGTWSWDLNSGRVIWSEEMFHILGLSPGAIEPNESAFWSRLHPDDLSQAASAAEQGQREGVLPLVDCRLLRPDGEVRYVTVSGSYLFDAAGTPQRMVGAVLDRSDSLRVEAQLRHALNLLEEAQSFAHLGSWRYAPDNDELEWSQEFRRIAGLPLDETPSVARFLQCIHEEDRPTFVARYRKSMQSPYPGELEGRVVHPNGEVRHIKMRGALVSAPGKRVELRGTLLDVTDQVKLREELVHAQKMEAVGRLAGGIAHDFNNLLTIVTGNLELLADDIGPTPELEDSFKALDSASNLTRRLLAFGRKAQLTLKLIHPNELVTSTLTLLNRLVGDQISLEAELSPHLPSILVDALEIERALVNLVVNAKNVMPQGGVVTLHTAERQLEQKTWVEISVLDEGPGISSGDLPHLFEPFYTTRSGSGGTGMGLATVLGTAEQHGGTVFVQHRASGGTSFTLRLPAAATDGAVESVLPVSRMSPLSQRRLRILVIDDERQVADVARRILTTRGHQVEVAYSPEQALGLWAKQGATFELVVCDVVMPRIQGPELIQKLQSLGPSPHVLFISGYNEASTHSNLGYPFLAKPFTAGALLDAVMAAAHVSVEKAAGRPGH